METRQRAMKIYIYSFSYILRRICFWLMVVGLKSGVGAKYILYRTTMNRFMSPSFLSPSISIFIINLSVLGIPTSYLYPIILKENSILHLDYPSSNQPSVSMYKTFCSYLCTVYCVGIYYYIESLFVD